MILIPWEMIWAVGLIAYREIPENKPPGLYFSRSFLRGLYSEGHIDGGKFAFQNRLG